MSLALATLSYLDFHPNLCPIGSSTAGLLGQDLCAGPCQEDHSEPVPHTPIHTGKQARVSSKERNLIMFLPPGQGDVGEETLLGAFLGNLASLLF